MGPVPHRQPSFRSLFALVGALVLIEVMFYSALAPLLPYYAHHLHLSKGAAGVLTAAYAAGSVLFALPLGLVVARVGVKRTIVVGAFALAGSSLVFGFGRSPAVLDSARLIQGIAGTAIWIAGITWVADAAPEDRHGETVGALLGIAIGGALLGPVIGSAARLTSPEIVFSLVAATIATLGAWAFATPAPAGARLGGMAPAALRAAARDGRVWAGTWFTMLPATLLGVLDVLVPLRLNALGAGALVIGGVFLVSALLEAGASPIFGRLTDRYGPPPLIRVGLIAAAAFAVLLPLPDTSWLLALIAAPAGVAIGIAWVPANTLLSGVAEEHRLHQSMAFALWAFGWAAGIALGSAVGAPLAEATSDTVPYAVVAVMCVVTWFGVAGRTASDLPTTPRPS